MDLDTMKKVSPSCDTHVTHISGNAIHSITHMADLKTTSNMYMCII